MARDVLRMPYTMLLPIFLDINTIGVIHIVDLNQNITTKKSTYCQFNRKCLKRHFKTMKR